jgi:hypothetical protein
VTSQNGFPNDHSVAHFNPNEKADKGTNRGKNWRTAAVFRKPPVSRVDIEKTTVAADLLRQRKQSFFAIEVHLADELFLVSPAIFA